MIRYITIILHAIFHKRHILSQRFFSLHNQKFNVEIFSETFVKNIDFHCIYNKNLP